MSTENTPEGTPEHPSPDRPRHRRSSLVAISVAAAVLLAGGGSAYWASTASDGEGADPAGAAGKGDPPPLRLDGYGPPKGEEADAGIAPGEPNPQGGAYRADGPLPDGPDSAAVYRPKAEVTRAEVERLAKALDVPGAPRLVDGTWKLGLTRDASGPALDVAKKAPGTWTFTRYGKGGGCTEPSMSGPSQGKDDSVSAARCPAPGDLPSGSSGSSGSSGGATKPVSEAKAEQVVAPVLKAIGLSDAKLDASQTAGGLRTVNADPVQDGLPTYGRLTGMQVGADGQLVSGSGHLAKPTKGAEYPVSGAKETLERLNRSSGGGRVGIGGCASAVPDKGGDAVIQSCQSPGPDQPEPAKVRAATFGLAVAFSDGQQALVPSWLFEVEQPGATGPQSTFTVTHPAVVPRYIADPAPGKEPGRESGKPSPDEKDVTSYSAEGRELTLQFWGGACDDYSVTAEESSSTVKVKITGKEKEPGRSCIMIAKDLEEKVTLKEPLGDRKVVDTSTGKDVAKTKN